MNKNKTASIFLPKFLSTLQRTQQRRAVKVTPKWAYKLFGRNLSLPRNAILFWEDTKGAPLWIISTKANAIQIPFFPQYFIVLKFPSIRYTDPKSKHDSHAIRESDILYSCYGIHSLFVLLFIGYANALCFAIKRELMSQQERCDCHQQYFSQLKYHLSVWMQNSKRECGFCGFLFLELNCDNNVDSK